MRVEGFVVLKLNEGKVEVLGAFTSYDEAVESIYHHDIDIEKVNDYKYKNGLTEYKILKTKIFI